MTWEAGRPADRRRQRALVIGAGLAATRIATLRDATAESFSILGFVDDAPDAADHLPGGLPLLGKTDDLLNLIDELQPDLVLVALNDMRRALPVEDLLECWLRDPVLRGLRMARGARVGEVGG